MGLTPFNAHCRSLSSVAVTAVHSLHLQDYTATNLCVIEVLIDAIL